MSVILHIETATPVCSCALSENGQIIFNRQNREGLSHAVLLGVFVDEAVAFARSRQKTIDAIAVSSGPGSYTGLRIGVSEAKGLSYGLGIPLIAILTPLILAQMMVDTADDQMLLCPMIDARRMEVFATVYDRSLETIRATTAEIITPDSFSDLLAEHKILFFGNGADKCKNTLTHPNALFVDDIHPLAVAMIPLGEKAFAANDFVDVAYFEPHYLKEFVATVPKNKVFEV
jgi:tRNA threonylcarbamoyladenosine biosynthesis protein TsaB